MARRSPAPRETRARILKAALEVFGDVGLAGASPEDIAARAGVTKGAFYYYFADKEDLARDLHREIWERLSTQAIAAVDPASHTIDNLERSLRVFLTALRDLGAARFFLREFMALGPKDDELQHASVDLIKNVLRDGIDRGDIVTVDPHATARLLLGMFSEATLHVLEGGDDAATFDVIGRILGSLSTTTVKAGAKR